MHTKYLRGSVNIWVFIITVILIIVAAGLYWLYQTQSLANQPSKTQVETSSTGDDNTTPKNTSTAEKLHTTTLAGPQSAHNQYGTIIATPTNDSTWLFAINGSFGVQQDSYQINFGDGSQENLTCTKHSEDYVCSQFASVTHTYAPSGKYRVGVIVNTRGLGNNDVLELLSVNITTN